MVCLTGELVRDPELRAGNECRLRLAVPRYSQGGTREPGIVYVDATAVGLRAREDVERLSVGSRIGLAGRLDDNVVLIDQLDLL